jgi:alkylated DNA repair dioxygenase AlkB
MAQPGLFTRADTLLLDDASGSIRYRPDVLDADRARHWFEVLREQVPWRSQRREMYGREVNVPRLLASYRLADPQLPAVLAEAARLVAPHVDAPFDSVGLNLYRDQADSVAPHNDHLYEIGEGQPIALLSLGATRRMTIREKQPPRRAMHIDLEPGSLLVMSYETQLHYDHGVPKQRTPVGPRISLAFRVRKRTGATRGRY